jgi:hypothetical protein
MSLLVRGAAASLLLCPFLGPAARILQAEGHPGQQISMESVLRESEGTE